MLEDIYTSCASTADSVLGKGWRKQNKNDLINLFVDEPDDYKRSAYSAAIICRYWSILMATYSKSYMGANIEDIYDCFIEALMYISSKKSWRDPTNKLYNDPNGPDKAFNVCIKSRRTTFFQQSNCACRKVNHGVQSLEALQEDIGDCITPVTSGGFNEEYDFDFLVQREWKNHNTLYALVIDLILTSDVFSERKNNNFDMCRLLKRIHDIDDRYYHYFARQYYIKYEDVKREFDMYKNAKNSELKDVINFYFSTMNLK